MKPVIFWFRSDLRLADNAGLAAACGTGKPVIPVFILDDEAAGNWAMGAASKWWLHHSLAALSASLEKAGFPPLVLTVGAAQEELDKLIGKTGADGVFWNRCYEPWAIARDTAIKKNLQERNIDAVSSGGYLLFEPWQIKNKTGQPYKVFTPFSKACLEYPPRPPSSRKLKYAGDAKACKGMNLEDLNLLPEIKWYNNFEAIWQPGEAGAQARLKNFMARTIEKYKITRDIPALEDGVSRLSPHLHFGEVSPHQCWHAAEKGKNAAAWQRQLLWREFSYHLLYHWQDFPDVPWNKQFAKFPWRHDEKALTAWQKGLTGIPIVDAGMRELWQTGWMHNRVRMIVGSFLVKNLLIDWREGEKWFWDTLVDADLGNNASGWQWIAGCGADAAPYFRIFNPLLQSRKFDPQGSYIRRYVQELKEMPDDYIHAPWEAPTTISALAKNYPQPIIDLPASRDRALATYAESKKKC